MITLEAALYELDAMFEREWRQVVAKNGYTELANSFPEGGVSVTFPMSVAIPGEQDTTVFCRTRQQLCSMLLDAKERVRNHLREVVEDKYEELNSDQCSNNPEDRDPVASRARTDTRRFLELKKSGRIRL